MTRAYLGQVQGGHERGSKDGERQRQPSVVHLPGHGVVRRGGVAAGCGRHPQQRQAHTLTGHKKSGAQQQLQPHRRRAKHGRVRETQQELVEHKRRRAVQRHQQDQVARASHGPVHDGAPAAAVAIGGVGNRRAVPLGALARRALSGSTTAGAARGRPRHVTVAVAILKLLVLEVVSAVAELDVRHAWRVGPRACGDAAWVVQQVHCRAGLDHGHGLIRAGAELDLGQARLPRPRPRRDGVWIVQELVDLGLVGADDHRPRGRVTDTAQHGIQDEMPAVVAITGRRRPFRQTSCPVQHRSQAHMNGPCRPLHRPRTLCR